MRMHALRISALLVSAAFAQQAFASGYHFGTQSVSSQATANASGAEAGDASTIFANPAGLSHVDGDTFSGVLDLVLPHGEFTDTGTHTTNLNGAVPGFNGVSPGGDNGGNFTKATVVPHLYLSHKVNPNLTLGFGAFVPFGSDVKYDSNWVGRYDVIETKLATLALNPSFAYRFNDHVTIGGGVTAQYMYGKLVKGADMGSGAAGILLQQISGGAQQAAAGAKAAAAAGNLALAQQLGAQAAALAGSVGPTLANLAGQPTYDGQVSVSGDDWGYGFNLGTLIDVDPHTRFGIAYRSEIHHKLSGTATWTVSPAYTNSTYLNNTLGPLLGQPGTLGSIVQSQLNNQFTNSAGSISVDTPESLSINAYHDFSDSFSLMADVTRTKHSRFQALTVNFANTLPPANIPERWADTTKYSLGGAYRLSDSLQLRAGLSYDESPVTNANRTPALPDGDRRWYSFGANWAMSKQSSMDIAYSYVTVGGSQMTINNYDNGGLANGVCDSTKNTSSCATTVGNVKVYSSLLGMQYNYKF